MDSFNEGFILWRFQQNGFRIVLLDEGGLVGFFIYYQFLLIAIIFEMFGVFSVVWVRVGYVFDGLEVLEIEVVEVGSLQCVWVLFVQL